MLTEIVRALKVFAAYFTRKGDLWTFVRALMDHQIVGFCESSLAVFADVFAFWAHFTTKVIALNFQYGKHFGTTFCLTRR